MKNKFIVIDTETAPLPHCDGCDPLNMLVYDLGYIITDLDGIVYEKQSLVIRETFRNVDLMQSAYYANKIPAYVAGLMIGEWVEMPFIDAWKQLTNDCKKHGVKRAYAYNARFDRDVLNTTIKHYSKGFKECFLPYGVKWYDIMAFARNAYSKNKRFIKYCELTGQMNSKGKPSMKAETLYRYIIRNVEFTEAHTAVKDCEIEADILRQCYKTNAKRPKTIGAFTPRQK